MVSPRETRRTLGLEAGKGWLANKKANTAAAKAIMEPTWLEFVEGHKKQDDLCDAVLQAEAWRRMRLPELEEEQRLQEA